MYDWKVRRGTPYYQISRTNGGNYYAVKNKTERTVYYSVDDNPTSEEWHSLDEILADIVRQENLNLSDEDYFVWRLPKNNQQVEFVVFTEKGVEWK